MKREDAGQGLVEYALILVLVAIVVIAILEILGPVVGNVFSNINESLVCGLIRANDDVVPNLGVNAPPTTINVKENDELVPSCKVSITWSVKTPLTAGGKLINNFDGTFTYTPPLDFSGEDQFEYEVCKRNCSTAHVVIMVGEASASSMARPAMHTSTRLREASSESDDRDDKIREVLEEVLDFQDQALEQEEHLHEGTDLTVEAFVEFLEVVIEHLDEIGNEDAANTYSVLRQTFLDKNFEETALLLGSLSEDLLNILADLPEEVVKAAADKMLPRLEKSSQVLSGAIVSPEVADETIAAVEDQLPDDHPGKAEVLQLLNEAKDLVLARNETIQNILTAQDEVITLLQEILSDGG